MMISPIKTDMVSVEWHELYKSREFNVGFGVGSRDSELVGDGVEGRLRGTISGIEAST